MTAADATSPSNQLPGRLCALAFACTAAAVLMARAKMGSTAIAAAPVTTVTAGGVSFAYPATGYTVAEFERLIAAVYGTHFGWNNSNDADREAAHRAGAELTFGEVLPSGVAKMLDDTHLNARNAKVLYDIGCGFGKLALQAFLAFENLEKVVGVEICESRYLHAAVALRRLAENNPALFTLTSTADTVTVAVAKRNGKGQRTLQMRNHNLFNTHDVKTADVVICETAFPVDRRRDLVVLLSQLKSGARFLLYHRLADLPGAVVGYEESVYSQTATLHDAKDVSRRVLAQLTAIAPADRYDASWGAPHFDTWRKV